MFVIRLIALGMILSFVLVAVIVFRPSVLIGVSGIALDHSVGQEVRGLGPSGRECRERSDGAWRCVAADPSTNRSAYRVDVDWSGCWTGTQVSPKGKRGPRAEVEGCIDLWDHLRLF